MDYIPQRAFDRSMRHLLQTVALALFVPILLAGCGSNSSGMNDSEPTGPSFDSETIAPGETFSYTFEDTGTDYYCEFHDPDMQGTITVESGADSSGTAHVAMKNTLFQPAELSVQPGTKVVWTNEDGVDHTVKSGTPSSGGGGGGY